MSRVRDLLLLVTAAASSSTWSAALEALTVLNLDVCVLVGPVNIHDRVLRAMDVPGQNHRDPFFAPFFKALLQGISHVLEATSTLTSKCSIRFLVLNRSLVRQPAESPL